MDIFDSFEDSPAEPEAELVVSVHTDELTLWRRKE